MASRIELKGWVSWRNIRGTGISLEEAKALISATKVRLRLDEMNVFDWDLTDRDQGTFDTKMMVFLWFKEGVTPMMGKKVLNDVQQGLTNQPLPIKGVNVRATIELDPVTRPWNKAQAISIGVMKEYANLPREAFDIMWVDSVAAPLGRTALPIARASFTVGATWVLNFEKNREFEPQVDLDVLQTLLLHA